MPALVLRPLPMAAAAVLHVVLSALWFNAPFLFAARWLAAIGKTPAEAAEDFSAIKVGYAFIAALAAAAALDTVIQLYRLGGILNGLLIGAGAGLLLAASNSSVRSLFAGRPTTLLWINAGHDLISYAAIGALLGLWR